MCFCENQRPAVKEKLAASLILLFADLLLGLSMDKELLVSGGSGGLVTAEEFLHDCSGGSELPSAAASSDSPLSIISVHTHTNTHTHTHTK